jgi:hypothetical protein
LDDVAEDNATAGAVLGAVGGLGGVMGAVVGAVRVAEDALGKMFGDAQASAQKFEVKKDTVLQSGKVIRDQAEVLLVKLGTAQGKLWVNAEGEVNQKIAAAWNSRLVTGDESYAGRVRQYIDSLTNLSEQLRDAATQYGFSDEEVKAAFGEKSVG